MIAAEIASGTPSLCQAALGAVAVAGHQGELEQVERVAAARLVEPLAFGATDAGDQSLGVGAA